MTMMEMKIAEDFPFQAWITFHMPHREDQTERIGHGVNIHLMLDNFGDFLQNNNFSRANSISIP